MTKRIFIIPDTQIPYDSRKALKAVIRAIGDLQPDEVIHIGDVMDFPTTGRWSKGYAAEYAQSVKEDCDQAKRRLLEPLRAVYDGPVGFHEGNHDERPRVYLEKYAPALAQFNDSFHIENMLDFDGFGVTLLDEFNPVAPGWISTHGHRGQISLSRIAGNTALGAARKFNTSVVCGHTHRGAVLSETKGYGGVVNKVLTGMEVGHLMDMRQASYLKGGTGNWQMGFGMLYVDGQYVRAEWVPIHKGRFTVDGHTWEV